MTSKEYWQMRAHQAQLDEYRYSEDAFFYINGVMGEAKEKLWEKLLYYLTLLTKETGLSADRLWEKLSKGELEHYKMSLAEYLALAPKAVTPEEMLRLSMASHLHQIDRVTAMTEEINRYTYLAYEKYYQETKRLLEDTYQRELDRLEKEAVDAESTERFFYGSEQKADRPALPKPKEPESEPDREKKAEAEAERPKTPELPTKPESRKADKESESQGRSEDKKPDGRPETGQKPEKALQVDKRKMDQILKEPWGTDERNFSERIWKDRQALANELKRELMQATATGEKLDAVAGRIAERFNVHQKVARRLVHTENAYMTSKARLARYQQEGIEEYQVIATLDLKTSTICRSLDKKIFPVAQAQIGVNAPPLHPHCRSTTIAWHGRESSTRAARNPVTGKSELVDGKLNYQEWYDKYVKGNPEAEAREKMWQNRYEDDKQYQRYKKILGKNAPKNLEEFQKMKYTEKERWESLQSYFKEYDTLPKDLSFKIYYTNLKNKENWKAVDFSPKTFEKHYQKHKKEYENISEEQYKNRAKKLLNIPVGGEIKGFTNKNGYVFRYNEKTNEFATAKPNGVIETLFKPKEGKEYYRKEYEKYEKM